MLNKDLKKPNYSPRKTTSSRWHFEATNRELFRSTCCLSKSLEASQSATVPIKHNPDSPSRRVQFRPQESKARHGQFRYQPVLELATAGTRKIKVPFPKPWPPPSRRWQQSINSGFCFRCETCRLHVFGKRLKVSF